ncbi:prolyl aminopeptidase [Algihabitans albus]|uniref:prolyl aminopeptidase n=1 Tax=Algihabitans albus TaxID=2164067 RepID=UPI000E5CB735|nr:prolyl aminopeptidase [Algihabitans albus]
MAAQDLFPPIQAYETGLLAVDNLHTIYWEQSGHPEGRPVLFVHGGPGAGASPDHRRFFDPAAYRIVIFDQRGAGRSTPLGETRANTTQHLIADMEMLRVRLGIERWHLFGGSWGSTLALAYAQAHPERVSALLLRGIFLCRKKEVDWFLYGMRTYFPEVWERFSGFIPKAERNDLLDAYYTRLMDPDPEVHMPAARSWSTYEGACSTLMPSPETVAAFGEDSMALGLARIEAHYFVNKIFLPDDALLERASLLRDLPGAIVQGRYDTVCPPTTAYDLHRAWPAASFRIIPDAGHSAMEPGIRRALVEATERFKNYA